MKHLLYLLFITSILLACKNTTQHADDAHAHDAKLQLTAYSNNMELFAEADPFVVGQNSGILAHFTWLENFKPLEGGEVTVSLIIGKDGAKQTLTKALKPGIYKFEIQPQVAGVGKIVFDINSDKGKAQIIVNNITVYTDRHDADHAAERDVASETNATVFTKEQSWKVDFATAYPKTEAFGQVIKTTAQVQSAQGDEIIVSAKAAGVVLLAADNVLEGKGVSNGETLFSIASSGLASNNTAVQFAEAKNNFEKATADYDRAKALAKDQIVSAKDLLVAKTQYENAKAVYSNMNKNFSASGQSVKSPMSGFVKQVFVQNGQSVEAGQAIVSVSQNKTLLLRAEVHQKYASVLGTITGANIRTINNNQTYTLEDLNGIIISYGKAVNSDNYLIPVSMQIDNKAGFVSGGFVEIYLKSISNAQALTVPNVSLLEEQGVFFVYVQVHPELFEKRVVKVGASDGLRSEIISGITNNDRIVTHGAIMIKLAQATGTLDAHAGHVH